MVTAVQRALHEDTAAGLRGVRLYNGASAGWWGGVLSERAEAGGPLLSVEWALLAALAHIRELEARLLPSPERTGSRASTGQTEGGDG